MIIMTDRENITHTFIFYNITNILNIPTNIERLKSD